MALLLRIPAIQNKIKYKAEATLNEQLNAKTTIGYFSLGFPKKLKVHNVLISKGEADTLAFLGEFSININILPLFNHKIIAQKIELKNVKGDIGKLMEQLPEDSTTTSEVPHKDTESNSWKFAVNRLSIESSYIDYRDEEIGFNLILDIGYLNLHLGFMDIDTLISCKKIEINETQLSYESLPTIEDNDTSASVFADIRVDEAFLENSGFTYIDSAGAILFYTGGNKIDVSDLLVDITNEKISLNEGFVENSAYAMEFLPVIDTTPETDDYLNWGPSLWRIEGNELELNDFRFSLNYKGETNPAGHFNSKHINIFDVKGLLSDFVLDEDIMQMKIRNLSAKEKNGLNILNLNAELSQKNSLFSIDEMEIKTPFSSYLIDLSTNISPTNYMNIAKKDLDIDLEIKSENWFEIDYFYPFVESVDFLSDNFLKNNFELKVAINGALNNINIDRFDFHFLDSTQMIVNGNIKDLSNPDSIKIDLNIKKLMISKNDTKKGFTNILPDSSWSLPEYVIVKGLYQGNNNKHSFAGNIKSNVGVIKIKNADINFGNVTEYKVALSANLKKLNTISNTGLEKAAFKLNTSFKGENIYGANGIVNLNIDSLNYNKYNYKELDIAGELANGQFGIKLNSSDTNFLFNIAANGDILENRQDIDVDIDVRKIDLNRLNLYNEEFKINGKAAFAVFIAEEKNYGIEAKIQSLDFCFSDTLYKMHPIKMSFVTNSNSTDFKLTSFYYNLDFTADDYITDVANSLIDLPGYYLADAENDSVTFNLPEIQIAGKLDYPEAFARLFFPDFPAFEKLTVKGAYNKNIDEIDFRMSVSGVNYNTLFADSLIMSVSGSSDELKYTSIASIGIADLMNGKFKVRGNFKNSELISDISYIDTFSKQYLNITARIDTVNESTIVYIIPDSLIFSYDRWEINPNNQIVINPSYIEVKEFDLSSDEQQISINSFPENNPQNLELKLNNFNLGSLEHLFALDTIIAGTASCDIKFTDLFNNPAIDGNLIIKNMSLYGFEAGELGLTKFVNKNNLVQTEMFLKGEDEDVLVSGSYDYGNDKNAFNFNFDLNGFDLSNLNYLLEDYIKDAKGSLIGKINIGGDLNNPLVNGNLNFRDAGVGIISINNYFSLGNESITIKDNVIDFGELSITNKKNQSAKISGTVSFGLNNKLYSNLMVKTDNMEILNSTRDDNEMLFGLLKAQANMGIKGTPTNMKVDANIKIDKTTDITYVFPDNLAINDNKGVVRFHKFNSDTIIKRDIAESSPFFTLESFNDIKSKVDIEDGAKFKLFFDSGGTNFLNASINGTMNYTLYHNNTDISGMFEIEKGNLHYSIPMVTIEDFNIESGSYITMSKDVYNPHLNIIASANIRASTEGLMADYNKVMTFKVLLYMIGDLNNVKLRFDISSETSDALVSARIARLTDQERNVNALNLLVRGAFIISVHGTEAGSASMAGAQMDKFYASQLNHLISDNIHFVDVHFDVQSFKDYNSSGDEVYRRNYYYNIGKSILNDRARISYKGSLGVSSDLKSEQVNSNFVQNELEVEMKITKDGTYRGVFFRKDKYEGLLEGEVVETGGGIRIKKNFYSVKDVFTKDRRENKKDKKMKIK